jgi:hypothetical protein
MMHRFDLWLGKTMFVPLVIRICQRTKLSQYTLHTYIWLVILLYNLLRGPSVYGNGIWGWLFYGFLALVTLFWVIMAAVVPDSIKTSATWLRYSFIFFFCFDCFGIVMTALVHKPMATAVIIAVKDWFILLAEYALTIKTIPPLEAKEKKLSGKLARQKA